MHIRRSLRAILLVAVLAVIASTALSGCGAKPSVPTETAGSSSGSTDAATATPEPPATGGDGLYTPTYKPNGAEVAVIKTNKGTITAKLYGKEAPIHVGNFVELAQKGFYNGTRFHRYVPGFVIQGGDPQTKGMSAAEVVAGANDPTSGLGTGGPGYSIKAEYDPAINPKKHTKGALGMARSQDPDSAGSQFYFALEALPQLDAQYTVFGQITKGEDVMAKLKVGDIIESVTIEGATK